MGLTLRILQTPFYNQFDNLEYSHEDFKQFGVELRGALNTNLAASGLTVVQRTAYSDALDQYLADMGNNKSTVAFQKGSTAGENVAWEAALKEVRRKEGTLRGVYDKGSPQYLQFFPQGLLVFNKARKGDRLDLLDNLILRFTNFAADFPGAAGTLTSTKSTYMASAGTQADAKGEVKGGRSQRDLSRLALANNMHEVWLIMAGANLGNPDVVKTFFNVSIFNKGTNADTDGKGLLRFRVTNSGGTPLINSDVLIHDQQAQLIEKLTTDDNGYAKSLSLNLGFYDATFSHPGHLTQTWQYQVFDNNDPLNEVMLSSE